jgi:UDP-N-acetylglucosamine--N-acetylmuramyl-(pentapeptide) pyrophosphoryl-undecaprenol N-acetylglucosamine transferase
MAEVWGAADVAVSRAGAGSVAEAWANAVPTLFLPYPYHKDQHQRFNAGPLEEAGAAVIADDLIEAGANAAGAGQILVQLLTDESRVGALRAGLRELGPADGARRIAEMLRSP